MKSLVSIFLCALVMSTIAFAETPEENHNTGTELLFKANLTALYIGLPAVYYGEWFSLGIGLGFNRYGFLVATKLDDYFLSGYTEQSHNYAWLESQMKHGFRYICILLMVYIQKKQSQCPFSISTQGEIL